VTAAALAPERALARVIVIGLGNSDRGDDGVGGFVANELAGRLPPEVAVTTRRGDLLSLIEEWRGFDAAVCIDAAARAGAPGSIHRIDLSESGLPGDLEVGSSHALGLAETIELARTLALAPRRIVLYAIEGARFQLGEPLTPAVAAAAREVVDRVAAEAMRLLRDIPPQVRA